MWVENHEVAAQLAMDGGRARQGCAEETELHPHEKIGEDDPDDRGDQFGTSVRELEPGDGETSERASHLARPSRVDDHLGPRVREAGHFPAVCCAQLDAHLDDAGVDVGDGVIAEDDLAADDQVFANDLAGEVGFQRGNAYLGLLADFDLADVLLVHLGHGVHDLGVADFDDSLVADTFARPDVNAQDLPFDR